MLDQDNNFYLISLNILITYLLDNVRYYREKFHVDHFWELLKECKEMPWEKYQLITNKLIQFQIVTSKELYGK